MQAIRIVFYLFAAFLFARDHVVGALICIAIGSYALPRLMPLLKKAHDDPGEDTDEKVCEAPQVTLPQRPKIDYNHEDVEVPSAPAVDAYAYSGSQQDYFYHLLRGAFPECTIYRDVDANDVLTLGRSSAGAWECRCGGLNTGEKCTLCGKARPGSSRGFKGALPGRNCGKISYLLLKNGRPKVAVILGDRETREEPRYVNTRRFCEKNHIDCQFYIDTFRNKASYVYSRIRSGLD